MCRGAIVHYMARAEYFSIKLNKEKREDTIQRLKQSKPDDVSWGAYLDELHRKAHAWDDRGSDVL